MKKIPERGFFFAFNPMLQRFLEKKQIKDKSFAALTVSFTY